MLGIQFDRESELPIWRQIYQALKELILTGQLKAGEAIPSTRELSRELMVSRNTISEAYEQLISEGFLMNRQGAATRIADEVSMEINLEDPLPHKEDKPKAQALVSFQTGRPDVNLFPRFLWQQLLHRAGVELPLSALSYSGPQGMLSLREEIANWLFRSRGHRVLPEDIFITAGATHALNLTAELLGGQGQNMMMEDPCHSGMLHTFVSKGCNIIPIPVDEEGIQTDRLGEYTERGPIYVTPSHQFPLGGILSASRRTALLRYARYHGLYIIEDDYDSEFRYRGEAIAPLHELDPQQVIYIGTFSKSVFPALRIGYAVVPHMLQSDWRRLRTYSDVQNPSLEQAALAEFLRTRKFDRHVKKMRKVYGERRRILIDSLSEFGYMWNAIGDAAGLHVAIDFPELQFQESFFKKCQERGLYVIPVENHCITKGRHRGKLLLGYGHLNADEIRLGMQLLQELISSISQVAAT